MWFLQFVFGFVSFVFWFLYVLWVDFSVLFGFWFLCSFGLIFLCPFGVDLVFLAWFLHVCVLLGFDFCIVWVVISQFSSFVSNSKLPDGFNPLNWWLEPPVLIRTYGWLQVHFTFTRVTRVGCKLTPNLIWHDLWTALDTSTPSKRTVKNTWLYQPISTIPTCIGLYQTVLAIRLVQYKK